MGYIPMFSLVAILSFMFVYNLVAAIYRNVKQVVSGTDDDLLLGNMIWAGIALSVLIFLFFL